MEVRLMQSHGTTPNIAAQAIKSTTRHGFLVALGWVAQRLNLAEILNRHLRIKQKTYAHTPVDKVVEALVAILGNCRYMKDLNFDPEPLVADPAVAQAWGQERFAHFSTVCATFSKLTEENVQQLSDALAEIQAPLLQQEVAAVAGPDRSGMVIVDIDLTGQKVRGETRQYTGTDFGYIQGKLARGYQIAAAFLSGKQQRFAIDGLLKSGKANSRSGACLLELIPRIEARIGRPLRRVEWVEACLAQQKARVRQLYQQLQTVSGKGSARRKQKLQREFQEEVQHLREVNQRLRQYRQENRTNLAPLRILLRADSAFGTPEVIQRLLELGYEFTIKSYSGSNVAYKHLFDAVPAENWVEVEKNRFASEAVTVPGPTLLAPYPVRLVAMRRWDADGREVRSVILTTLQPEELTTTEVVKLYHGRQTIEAGFQEWKGTFHFGTPRLRKYEANAAFTQLVLFAFNLVRWAWRFLSTNSPKLAEAGSRLLVRVAARCRATIRCLGDTLRLVFSRGTPLAGAEITLNRATPYPYALLTPRMSSCSRET
ncbi:transposase-like protein [Symbiobacterium thermophilum IAM 14863]|uniref:Transposase-like protein n=2 Tax=Symbiobacterium thermophilum TaxID=2734 RepID=Q67SN1_SYMTH|nr:transposase-like protein [Symbiobacterium thermophilum IAM 14863]